jgi:hypothetical protein
VDKGVNVGNTDKAVQSICDMIKEATSNDIRVGQLLSIAFDRLAKNADDPFFVPNEKLAAEIRAHPDS